MGQLATWADLGELRRRGMRPELPVYVTDRWRAAQTYADIGCLAILHKRGEPMPVAWLQGLDVLVDFDRCETAGKVKRLMDSRGVEPRWMRAWCRCAREFVATCGACDQGDEPWCR